MLEINAPFTNVTLQTFASEGDLALANQKWEKIGPKFVNRLEKNGLLSYEIATIWNKDSKLMRFVIFRYKSSDAFKRCLPIWEEIEKAVFDGVLIKVTAYRGVTEEYWTASDAWPGPPLLTGIFLALFSQTAWGESKLWLKLLMTSLLK